MKISSTLQKLIYGYNGTIVVSSNKPDKIFKEIETVRNGLSLEGWIFRPAFASGVEFQEYTEEDYLAIYAQWSISFGWSNIFETFFEKSPTEILSDYHRNKNIDLSPLVTEDKNPIVKDKKYLYKLAEEFATSKVVLTENQKEIILNMPYKVLKKIYNNVDFTIRETKVLFVKKLFEQKDFNPFNEFSEIIPMVVALFSKGEPYFGQLNKSILKGIKVRIPISSKRKILSFLENHKISHYDLENIKKYRNFWKALLRELIIDNFDKTVKQYPNFKNIHDKVYSSIRTLNTDIEYYRKNGLLAEAFEIELHEPNRMLRNLLFYMRSPVGSTYPVKVGRNPSQITVKSDIGILITKNVFKTALRRANPKLLLQAKNMIENDSGSTSSKIIASQKSYSVKYSKPIPALNKFWVSVIKKQIEDAYSFIKKEQNRSLGKVYVDETLVDLKLNFSGRLDTSINTSGVFLPIGSKIDISEALKNGEILRVGASWKSKKENPLSLCLDPSIGILNGEHKDMVINWMGQNNTLKSKGEIIISSSGDITSCSTNSFSTELVDIDFKKLKESGSTKFFTAIINYDAPVGSLSEVETYVFFNIIKKKDRVLDNRKVKIPLDKMEYSYMVQEDSQGQIGLLFDLEKEEVEVLKIPFSVGMHENAVDNHQRLISLIEKRIELPNLYDAVVNSVYSEQLVFDKEEADTVISKEMENSSIINVIL